MHVQPQKEHEWLQQLVGDWTFENEATMEPGQPPVKFTGKESVRTLGGVWVLCEGQGEMPGGGIGYTIMTLGYDPAKKRFLGTFIGSMMTHLWIYDGQLDAASKILTLDADGPGFTPEVTTARYQDSIEFLSPDHRTLSSQILGPDGKWNKFMTAHYYRKK